MHESPTNRAARLAVVPDDLRPLVKAHLMQWDILPPPLQEEFFESEHALRYFTHVELPINPPMPPMPPALGWRHGPPGPDLAHSNTLSEDQRQKIAAQFNQFFELTPMEKKKALNTLSDAERQQMEKTLETFGKSALRPTSPHPELVEGRRAQDEETLSMALRKTPHPELVEGRTTPVQHSTRDTTNPSARIRIPR